MNEPQDVRLKRLAMRSMRRGIKEMDLILSAYATDRLARMDPGTLDTYESLLAENDQDLYKWVTGQGAAPTRFDALIGDIAAHARTL